MMNQEHVKNQIPDYVLGLLPRQERLWVEQHTAVCTQCHQLLQQESELSQLVRATLTAATQPASLRLRQLMPPPPRRPASQWHTSGWTRQLALAALLLTLLWAGLGLYQQQFAAGSTQPKQLAVTATMTQEPTMTLASLEEEKGVEAVTTAVPALFLEPSATPAPIPTPIAALPSLSFN
ncbi:MAG: zf-HC2 domain-containing protein [Ardenticatenaceae bacterium]|nr:zf-HC2 domain-containing protein [Ardenticatenaceae bacterium]